MNVSEEFLRYEPVPSHREKDTRSAQHHDQQYACNACDACRSDDELRPADSDGLKGTGDPSPLVDVLEGNHACQDCYNSDVQEGANHQRCNNANGNVALRPPSLLGVRGYRV